MAPRVLCAVILGLATALFPLPLGCSGHNGLLGWNRNDAESGQTLRAQALYEHERREVDNLLIQWKHLMEQRAVLEATLRDTQEELARREKEREEAQHELFELKRAREQRSRLGREHSPGTEARPRMPPEERIRRMKEFIRALINELQKLEEQL